MLPEPKTPPRVAARQNRVARDEQALPLLEEADAARGVARRVERAQAVAAGVDDVAFIDDHLDREVRGGLAESATQDGEVVAIGDLVGRQTVSGDDAPTSETRDRGNMVEMLMSEDDGIDVCRLHAERGEAVGESGKARIEAGTIRTVLSLPLNR